ncbi:IS21 family transposase [Alicyclobacillus sendaiensis]|uniref:IS21 family transposase n=1 Tax=Alicyclobacillus sendaiensis PA2 TaxID=3029425 RepID=A0ABT6XZL4_ALISE|nr:IS21 family transposase [Alicyclobacillus sendaiensis]MDI9260531.1 IS21 family transposase [Alicyclobacillus sendaiensis PA2]
MLKGGSIMNLHVLRDQGKSIRQIAAETGYSRNTVRKYLRHPNAGSFHGRRKRGSKLDPFKPVIETWMREGLYNCEVIYERLQALGYQGGRTLIKDFVRPHRPPRPVQAKRRYETPPGAQAQVDWGMVEYTDVYGVRRKLAVFVMVLSYSRMMYVEFTPRCDVHHFLRCTIHALEYFGGVPTVALTDRMKTVLLEMEDGHRPKWHPLFEDFALTVGLYPRVCKPRRPQTKGKVERMIDYVKEHFWPLRPFTDWDDLNRQSLAWCERVSRRIHGTTGERPCDRMLRERLRPLPEPERLEKFLEEERRVSLDGFISYDGVRYGVPWAYSGRTVKVRHRRNEIEIWCEGVCIAKHSTGHRVGSTVPLEGQYDGWSASNGQIRPRPVAFQVPVDEVETRPLSWYEALVEVSACCNSTRSGTSWSA